MLSRLLPRDASFFEAFEELAQLAIDAAKEFRTLADGNGNLSVRAERIKELEHTADHVVHRSVEVLHTTFITPFDRDHIFRLLSRLDDVIDFLDHATRRVMLYELKEVPAELAPLADVLVRATREVAKGMANLRDLKKPELAVQICRDIHRLENEGDLLHGQAVARLFKERRDPFYVMQWKEIYDSLEASIDRTEDVANVIEGIILEHA